jgi:expansin (peptidoglycan-binding protein)
MVRFLLPVSLLLALSGCSGADDDSGEGAGASHATSCSAEGEHSGQATYYDFADGSGACSFDPSPNDPMVAAMNAPDYAGSAACGSCARVSGPGGEITVRIVDLCPECPEGNLDLSPGAFELIAPLEQGRVPITWRYVACDVSGPLDYRFKDGSNQWWTGVQVRNHRHAIARFEIEKDGVFTAVPREDYNYFVAESGFGPGPFTFRVTDVYGGVVIDAGIELGDAVTRHGASQLPPCAD